MRTFITSIVPQHRVIESGASQAANNFCFSLIQNGCFDRVLSIVPPSYVFPESEESGISYYKPTKNILKQLLLFSLLSCKLRKDDHIWFYNLVPVNVVLFILLKFILRKNVYIILADYTPNTHFLSLQNLIGFLIRRCSGSISLSSRTTINTKNNLVIPGIISKEAISYKQDEIYKPLSFFFSGTLSEVTGFRIALKVFAQIPSAHLYISGRGSFPKEYEKYSNIHFLGMLPFDRYQDTIKEMDVCLNFRNPNLIENLNNFPSKVLEYFSHNKIVISTINYPEIKRAIYIKTEYDVDKIVSCITELLNWDEDKLKTYTYNQEFLKECVSINTWKDGFYTIENK